MSCAENTPTPHYRQGGFETSSSPADDDGSKLNVYCIIPTSPVKLLENKLDPRLVEAQAGQRLVFFIDAAHFVYAPFLALVWCFERLWVKAPSGRQRLNVLAALNAITHEIFTVQNLTYVTAERVCELLRLLAGAHPGMPITLVLDNARYQKRALVQALARGLGMDCYTYLLTRPTSM
jgi:hypothetical protein